MCAIAAAVAVGLSACAVDEGSPEVEARPTDLTMETPPTPTDVTAPEIMQVPAELSFDQLPDGPITNLNGCGRLVFCADPRFDPHFPSFCTRQIAGCNNDRAFADAQELCRQVCGGARCAGAYYVLGPC